MVRTLSFALLLSLVPLTIADEAQSTPAPNDNVSKLRAEALDLHSSSVEGVISGKSLDSILPIDTQLKITHLPLAATDTGAIRLPPKDITYRQAIRWSEYKMAELGNRVTVTIVAAPGGCGVKYKPVVGGQELDAGATKAIKTMDARWYYFSCDCQTPALIQRVDCTTDTVVSFTCPAKSTTTKPDKMH